MILRVEGKPDYTLVLPADEEYLDAVKNYLDIDVFADAMLCDIHFKVPYIGELVRDTDCPAVEDYDDFAEALEDIWQQDGALLTYAAVLEAEKPETLRRACELLRNLDNYQRITEAPTVTVSSDCRKRWGWTMNPSMSWTATWILRNTVRTAWKTTAWQNRVRLAAPFGPTLFGADTGAANVSVDFAADV